MNSIHIRSLSTDDLGEAAALLAQLNPETPASVISERLNAVLSDHPHYELIGAFSAGELVGVAGAWIATKIWCGRYLEIDNLVVDSEHRSSGIGSLLIGYFETVALERDCKILVMDSYTANHPSHRLYHRLGFEIWGFHFVKPVGDWKGTESH
jgi:GNAT superfamily N-acetyltransferase